MNIFGKICGFSLSAGPKHRSLLVHSYRFPATGIAAAQNAFLPSRHFFFYFLLANPFY
ncbi:hypothetical protein [Paraburkholderia sp.]|uniref:hypothetical protein n=1 Tax=Paraburkholderia sp. TaxID=1926495 RepID=UPI0025D99F8F|nr:hypothetical protein [Paraburkholderia sp.]